MKGNKKGSVDMLFPVVEKVSVETMKETINTTIKENGSPEPKELKNEVNDVVSSVHKDPVIYVKYGCKRTVHLGNYESATVDIGLTIPVGIEITTELEKKLANTQKYAEQYVAELMEAEYKGIMEYKNSRAK